MLGISIMNSLITSFLKGAFNWNLPIICKATLYCLSVAETSHLVKLMVEVNFDNSFRLHHKDLYCECSFN